MLDLIEKCIEYSEYSDHFDCFVDFSGHVSKLTIDVHENGWDTDRLKLEICYCNIDECDDYIENSLNSAMDELKALKESSDKAHSPENIKDTKEKNRLADIQYHQSKLNELTND